MMQRYPLVKRVLLAASGLAALYGFTLALLLFMPKFGCCPILLT